MRAVLTINDCLLTIFSVRPVDDDLGTAIHHLVSRKVDHPP